MSVKKQRTCGLDLLREQLRRQIAELNERADEEEITGLPVAAHATRLAARELEKVLASDHPCHGRNGG